jgi:hypothetical protein
MPRDVRVDEEALPCTAALLALWSFDTVRPVKPHHTAALPDKRSCQRPGCANKGQLRSQRPKRQQSRTIYLCRECFVGLPMFRLNDLFLRFADGEGNRGLIR